MPSPRKRIRNRASLLPVRCSGCGSDCHVEIKNIAEKSIHDIECERFSFTVCGTCYPAVAALVLALVHTLRNDETGMTSGWLLNCTTEGLR